MSHYGSFPGYYSLITIAPSQGYGIFSTINGGTQQSPYTINSLLHTYILDLLQGVRPWLDARMSTACFFPNDRAEYSTLGAVELNKTVPAWRNTEDYTGMYVHNVLGKITVQVQDSDLYMRYGLMEFVLYPQQRERGKDIYLAEATISDWMVSHFTVDFTIINDKVDSVLTPFSEGNDTAVFIKVTDSSYLSSFECLSSSTVVTFNIATCVLALLSLLLI